MFLEGGIVVASGVIGPFTIKLPRYNSSFWARFLVCGNLKSWGFSSMKYVSTLPERNFGCFSTFSKKGVFVCGIKDTSAVKSLIKGHQNAV